MPRLTQSVPRYRKHRASGQAVVTLNGRDIYLGPHGTKTSKAEYDRVVGEWMAGGRMSSPASRGELTIVEIIAPYLQYAKSYYRKNGKVTREYGCTREALKMLKELYGRTHADEFGPIGLSVVRDRMIAAGWTRKYINKEIGRVVRMFKWATSKEMIGPHVHQSLVTLDGLRQGRTEAPDRAPIRPVPDDVIEGTLEHLGPIVADMVRLQRLTGCRPDEVCSIRPCDVDRNGEVWIYRPASHKTEHHGRERLVFVGPRGQGILAPYLLRDASSFCFSPIEAEEQFRRRKHLSRQTPLSSGNRPGSNLVRAPKRRPKNRYDVNGYRRAIHRACDRAGVELWGPNRLRHSAATEIRSHFGLEAAQVALGHSAANVTQVYAERDWTLAAKVAKQLG